MSVLNDAAQAATSPKTAAIVSAATAGTGAADWFELIPDDIGKVATLVGIVLSVVLIHVHLLTVKKLKLEMDSIRTKEIERRVLAEERRRAGLATRRCDDLPSGPSGALDTKL